MPRRRFERITLAQLLLSGYAMVFGDCVFIDNTYAQMGVCASAWAAAAPRFQSVQSLYGAATGIPADRAGDIGGRFRISRICGYAAGG